jgi:hypothetical protein
VIIGVFHRYDVFPKEGRAASVRFTYLDAARRLKTGQIGLPKDNAEAAVGVLKNVDKSVGRLVPFRSSALHNRTRYKSTDLEFDDAEVRRGCCKSSWCGVFASVLEGVVPSWSRAPLVCLANEGSHSGCVRSVCE